jgi:hypothetical protein
LAEARVGDALALAFARPVAPRQEIRKAEDTRLTDEPKALRIAADRAETLRVRENAAASGGPCQPGKLGVQEQAGLADRFQGRRGKWGHRRYEGLGFSEALVAGEGASAAGTQLAALLDSFVEENLHV